MYNLIFLYFLLTYIMMAIVTGWSPQTFSLRTCKFASPNGKGNLKMWLELRFEVGKLSWTIYPGLCIYWSPLIKQFLKRNSTFQLWSETCAIVGLEDKGRGHEPGKMGGIYKFKKQGHTIPHSRVIRKEHSLPTRWLSPREIYVRFLIHWAVK